VGTSITNMRQPGICSKRAATSLPDRPLAAQQRDQWGSQLLARLTAPSSAAAPRDAGTTIASIRPAGDELGIGTRPPARDGDACELH
jgi:hypothetical protein